jgi:hypothetical protein
VGEVAAQDGVAGVGVAPELLDRLLQARLHEQERLGGQVVRDDRGAVEEERQEVLDAGGGHALRDVLVDRAARGIALELLAEVFPELRLPVLVERKLARRQEAHLVDLVDRALGVGVEAADALDQVVVELDPVGQRAAGRKDIDEAAANAVLARRHDLRDVRVARGDELRPQLRRRQLLALLEVKRAPGEVLDGRETQQRGRHRDDGDVEHLPHQLVQRLEPLRHQVLVRRQLVVGQRLPVGQEVDLEPRVEVRDFFQQALRFGAGCREDRERTPRAGGARDQERVGGAVQERRARPVPRPRQLDLQHVRKCLKNK